LLQIEVSKKMRIGLIEFLSLVKERAWKLTEGDVDCRFFDPFLAHEDWSILCMLKTKLWNPLLDVLLEKDRQAGRLMFLICLLILE